MSIFCNRENITMINAIKSALGAERVAQTNSRYNSSLATLRIYAEAAHKGRPKLAIDTITDLCNLRDAYNRHCGIEAAND